MHPYRIFLVVEVLLHRLYDSFYLDRMEEDVAVMTKEKKFTWSLGNGGENLEFGPKIRSNGGWWHLKMMHGMSCAVCGKLKFVYNQFEIIKAVKAIGFWELMPHIIGIDRVFDVDFKGPTMILAEEFVNLLIEDNNKIEKAMKTKSFLQLRLQYFLRMLGAYKLEILWYYIGVRVIRCPFMYYWVLANSYIVMPDQLDIYTSGTALHLVMDAVGPGSHLWESTSVMMFDVVFLKRLIEQCDPYRTRAIKWMLGINRTERRRQCQLKKK